MKTDPEVFIENFSGSIHFISFTVENSQFGQFILTTKCKNKIFPFYTDIFKKILRLESKHTIKLFSPYH